MMSFNADGNWSARAFDESLSFVCERPVGGGVIIAMILKLLYSITSLRFLCF